jgi:hypothetical protein
MTTENRDRLVELLHLGKLAERAHVQRLPDEIVDFFVAKIETLAVRRHAAAASQRSAGRHYYDRRAAVDMLDDLVQSIHDAVTAFDSEGLGSWQSEFDRWHASRTIKH